MSINQSRRISVTSLQISPVYSSSKLAYVNPGLSYFDLRNDFSLPDTMRYMACMVEVLNLSLKSERKRRVTGTFRINILNGETREVISSRDFSVKCGPDEYCVPMRVDVPLTADMVHPDIQYMVEVTVPSTGEMVVSRPLRFHRLDKAVAEYFTPCRAWLMQDSDETPLLHVDATDTSMITACFELATGFTGVHPELEVSAVRPDGERISRVVVPEPTETDGRRVVLAKILVPADDSTMGPLYMQVDCLGQPVAGCVLAVDGTRVEGCLAGRHIGVIPGYSLDKGLEGLERLERARAEDERIEENRRKADEAGRDYAEALAQLDSMVGMGDVKRQIRSHMAFARLNKLRREAGLQAVDAPLHAMFVGPAGTCKTSVARIIGRLLHGAGLLSSGHVVVRERATLLGQFYNSEAEHTLSALREAEGGILFIDEAYQLWQPKDARDPGRFVLETLMTALADESHRDWMLILAGYTEPMMRMFDMNPGLRSRIPDTNIYRFERYTPAELTEIAMRYLRDNYFVLTAEADLRLSELIARESAMAPSDFGNGRYVMNLIQTRILPAMAMRLEGVAEPSVADLSTITGEDIPA